MDSLFFSYFSYEVSEDDRSSQILPLLSFLITNGNTTVYQWRTGRVPTVRSFENIIFVYIAIYNSCICFIIIYYIFSYLSCHLIISTGDRNQ